MSSYTWCHGPKCHERQTTTRVRGNKGSKVLRTMKINVDNNYRNGYWKYFCDQTCLMDFMWKYYQEFIRLHPRTECLETPINDPYKNPGTYCGYWTIEKKEVDNNSNMG